MKKTKSVLLWFNPPPLKCSLLRPTFPPPGPRSIYFPRLMCHQFAASLQCLSFSSETSCSFPACQAPSPVCAPLPICSATHLFAKSTAQLAIWGLCRCGRLLMDVPSLSAAQQGAHGMYVLCTAQLDGMRAFDGYGRRQASIPILAGGSPFPLKWQPRAGWEPRGWQSDDVNRIFHYVHEKTSISYFTYA